MTTLDEKIREQLSAWMDGELPADEARFLERRLANEPELREQWHRMQLASSCMKGHALRLMPGSVAAAITLANAEAVVRPATGRPWLGWAVAASVALLALVVVPNWKGDADVASVPVATQPSAPAQRDPVASPVFNPTPASADLVASGGSGAEATPPATTTSAPTAPNLPAAPVVASDVADASQSPTDFPLVLPNGRQNWPRATLANGGNDPALEAYLIRHNQMMGDGGLSGFVPYVDVVTSEPQSTSDASEEGEANR